jgi:hypothetical protein
MASKADLLKKKNPPQRRPRKEDVGSLSLMDDMVYEEELRIKKQIQIHEELKPYIPPLREEEFARLEQNILEDGEVREKLLVWQTPEKEYFLLDGHHRYQIINKHKQRDLNWGIEVKKELSDIHEAKRFMRNLQLGRRNLTSNQMAYLRGCTYLDLKEENRAKEKREQQDNIKEVLAAEFKVGTTSIIRDYQFSLGLKRFLDDSLSEELQNEYNKILYHESALNKIDVVLLGKNAELPLDLSLKFKIAGGDLNNIVKLSQEERLVAMEVFLKGDQNGNTSTVTIQKPEESTVKAAPVTPAQRFEKWWKQQHKDLSKVIEQKNQLLIHQKREELKEQAEKINALLKELDEVKI